MLQLIGTYVLLNFVSYCSAHTRLETDYHLSRWFMVMVPLPQNSVAFFFQPNTNVYVTGGDHSNFQGLRTRQKLNTTNKSTLRNSTNRYSVVTDHSKWIRWNWRNNPRENKFCKYSELKIGFTQFYEYAALPINTLLNRTYDYFFEQVLREICKYTYLAALQLEQVFVFVRLVCEE